MSKKTSFLQKLFNRADQDGLRRRKRRRPEAQVERLEKRIALAVDVVTGAGGGAGEQWVTVLANDGSDVYLKMDATPTNDLLIADNASFVDSASSLVTAVEGADSRFDSIYVYNGSLVEQQVKFPNDTGYTPDFGLLPTSYPTASTQELSFLINSEVVRQDRPITGSIQLGDEDQTVITFNNQGTDGWQLEGNSADVAVTFGSSGGLNLITINSGVLLNAGTNAMPTLDLTFDRSSGSTNVVVSTSSGVAPPSSFSTFKLFNETTHQFVPGTLRGELSLYNGSYAGPQEPRPISFQVETTGTGVVPISFGDASNTQWSTARALSTSIPYSLGTGTGTANENLLISGEFHTETGQIFFETNLSGNSGGPVRMPIHLDNVQLGLRDLTNTDDSSDLLGTKFDNFPNDLTLFPGGTFSRSVIAELPETASEISI